MEARLNSPGARDAVSDDDAESVLAGNSLAMVDFRPSHPAVQPTAIDAAPLLSILDTVW